MVNTNTNCPQTHLRSVNQSGFLHSTWSSLATTTPDLLLICHGQLVEVYKAMLGTQSTFLSEILLTSTDPVLFLPEVRAETVYLMLDILLTGRCTISQADWQDLRQLLGTLGMLMVAENLEICSSREAEVASEKGKGNEDDDEIVQAHAGDQIQTPFPPKMLRKDHFCQMCGKEEKSGFNLRVHYTLKHFFSAVCGLVTDKTSSSCEVCGKKFEAELQWNYYRNIVRHRGAVHQEVMPFVRNICVGLEIACYECKICQTNVRDMKKVDPDKAANCTVFGQHLVELHFEDKIKKLISVGQKNCNLCDKKCKSEKMLLLHFGVSHGFAMKFYRSFVKDKRIRIDGRKVSERKPHVAMGIKKKCKFCKKLIAGSGSSWQNNMYNHYSRRHFSKDLLRDFTTDGGTTCNVCGLSNISSGRMVAHVGVKHRLVEQFLKGGNPEADISI